ncbi:protein HEXIM1-like [Ruditapes philippinarum]|uniref:protein HEXIM1-like n=1 Tax=Ruditapes philippinarum TaxID=129788 RepID=UPI00295BC3FA|nr:protein HEXIM1-like [Ruditapes philippinarum]
MLEEGSFIESEMFVLDTVKIVTGLRNIEIMDMNMAEILKKKKTRRGKKNRMRKSPGKSSNVFSTLDLETHNFNVKRGHRNRKFIRPTSPKAPMNSTQFLIEDRGNGHLDCSSNSPAFQGLSPKIEDFDSLSFYDSENDRKLKNRDGEIEYMPIDFEDTADFIGQEFEKDFNSHYNSINYVDTNNFSTNSYNEVKRGLAKLPKYTIIKKMFELEEKLKRLEKDAEENSPDSLKMRIHQLQEENSALKILILAQVFPPSNGS